jgi:hypothetical protein
MEVRNKTVKYVNNHGMRIVLATLLLTVFTSCTVQAVGKSLPVSVAPTVKTGMQPLLVELFTSEGCASCPPAEELLAKYQNEQPFENAEIITLAFHVDYWDYIGWKDKYASPLFTQRQRIYDRKFRTGKIYTPQMVVDGDIEFIGSREKDAIKAFKKAAKINKAMINLSHDDDSLSIGISGLSSKYSSTLFVAIAEDNLSSDIRDGENSGRNLTHLSVVRRLIGAARIPAESSEFEFKQGIQLEPDWKRENTKLVVFVQENQSRDVLAVAQITLPKASRIL